MSRAPSRTRPLTAAALTLAGALVSAAALAAATSASGAATVRASSGAFSIVVPHGFRDDTAAFSGGAIRVQIVIVRPRVHGFSTNMNVVRERTTITDIGALTPLEIAGIKRVFPAAHAFSKVESLAVSGESARAVGYLNPTNRLVHVRQIFVIHHRWAYTVTYTALAGSDYSVSLPSVAQVIAGWRWR